MKYILPLLLVLLSVGCMSVFVPNTPEGNKCSTACNTQLNECRSPCNGKRIDACEDSCFHKHESCLIHCPGAYKK